MQPAPRLAQRLLDVCSTSGIAAGICSSSCSRSAWSLAPSSTFCSESPCTSTPSYSGWNGFMFTRGKKAAAKAASTAPGKDGKAQPPDGMVEAVLLKKLPLPGHAKGNVVKVNAGWMRHELFPQGVAVYATPENVEKHGMSAEERSRKQDPKLAAERRLAKLVNSLNTIIVNIPRRNGFLRHEPDKMIGSVTAWDILTALERQCGVRLHESHLLMDTPIKAFGVFKVPLNLRTKDDRQVELTVKVDSVRWLNHGHAYV